MQASYIWIRFQFEGFHRWDHAPDVVAFLRSRHRHIFHVKIVWPVSHNDRHLEFFIQQAKSKAAVQELKKCQDCETWSCEEWASRILKEVQAISVEVSEDNENGATVCLQ